MPFHEMFCPHLHEFHFHLFTWAPAFGYKRRMCHRFAAAPLAFSVGSAEPASCSFRGHGRAAPWPPTMQGPQGEPQRRAGDAAADRRQSSSGLLRDSTDDCVRVEGSQDPSAGADPWNQPGADRWRAWQRGDDDWWQGGWQSSQGWRLRGKDADQILRLGLVGVRAIGCGRELWFAEVHGIGLASSFWASSGASYLEEILKVMDIWLVRSKPLRCVG